MNPLKRLKDATRYEYHSSVGRVLSRLATTTEKDCIGLLRIVRSLSSNPEFCRGIEKVIELLSDPQSQSSRLFDRVFNSLTPHGRQRLFQTLFYNGWIWSHNHRKRLSAEHGVPIPFLIALSPTNGCNLDCEGCYAQKYSKDGTLPHPLFTRILKECDDLSICFILITGGEPFVFPHLIESIEQFPHLFFHIYTNGTLLNRAMTKRLAQCGNVFLFLSLEGFQDTTDTRRGSGTFERILDSFQYLRNAGIPFGTSVTVTRQNLDEVTSSAFLTFLIAEGALANYYFMYMPVDGESDFSLMITPEQRNELRKTLKIIRKNFPIFIVDFWNDGPYVGGCIAGGRRYFHINANGDIEPCVFTHFATHNIHDSTILEALQSPLFRAIRKNQPFCSNHLCPCPIIDTPWIARKLIQDYQAYPTHTDSTDLYFEHYDDLLQFSKAYRKIADRMWEQQDVNIEVVH